MNTKIDNADAGPKLGTFGGVFTPSVLTILGIILFLRLGYVVGSAGLMKALMIIAIANAISVLTSISLSAVATNLKVRGGGDYYLISRTLGLEFGGALGIVLFLAQSVSIAFYCIGFGEAMTAMLPASFLTPRIVAFVAAGLLFGMAWLGADWATKFQYVVMVLLVASLASFFVGGALHWDSAVLASNWSAPSSGLPFWTLFAIFFPAVTGFTQGVSMSGDLKDPGKSLPLGTFLAVGVSIVIYFSVAVIFAAALPLGTLSGDYGAMKTVAFYGPLIDAGVIAATLSSAMASFLGAPRILQSLAGDKIFKFLNPFAKGVGPANNPRRGVLLSAAIAAVTIAAGNLNVIAPVVSMFFLISYGLLNYGTYFEARSDSPSFRPRFKYFDSRLSLLGALGCLGVMLAIDIETSLVAIAILFAIYQYLQRTAGPSRWADSRRSYSLQQIRKHLSEVASDPGHHRDWRPHILAFSNDLERRHRLLKFAEAIEGRSGFTTMVHILEGTDTRMMRRQVAEEEALRKELRSQGNTAFPLVVFAHDFDSGLMTLVQSYGVGPLKANTLLINWYSPGTEGNKERRERFNRTLGGAFRLGLNIVIANFQEPIETMTISDDPAARTIDVWWEEDATGRLSLLLAYLMTRNPVWEEARIRVITAAPVYTSPDGQALFRQMVTDTRITAEPVFLEEATPKVVADVSAASDVVFLPFRFRGDQVLSLAGLTAAEFLRWLPATALVRAAEDIDLDAAPEAGEAGQMAEAVDAVDAAAEKRKAAEKDAREAEQAAAEAENLLQRLRGENADAETITEAENAAQAAHSAAEKASRRAAKALAKEGHAKKEAEEMGAMPESPPADPEPEFDAGNND
ncbi:MAG: amino acid permease [Pseudomonadota bacterium]